MQKEGSKLKSQKKTVKNKYGFNANTAFQLGNTHKLEGQKEAATASDRGEDEKR